MDDCGSESSEPRSRKQRLTRQQELDKERKQRWEERRALEEQRLEERQRARRDTQEFREKFLDIFSAIAQKL